MTIDRSQCGLALPIFSSVSFRRHRRGRADQGQGRRRQAEGRISDHRRLEGRAQFRCRPLACRPGQEARLLWRAGGRMRVPRSRQPRPFDAEITLADGSTAQSESNKETTTIRCIGPGHYDSASTSIPTANSPEARRRSRCASKSPASIRRSRPCSPRTSPSIRSGRPSMSRASTLA